MGSLLLRGGLGSLILGSLILRSLVLGLLVLGLLILGLLVLGLLVLSGLELGHLLGIGIDFIFLCAVDGQGQEDVQKFSKENAEEGAKDENEEAREI